jgi:uncharacterized membrane protein
MNIEFRSRELLSLVMIILFGTIFAIFALTVLLPITLILGFYLWLKTRKLRGNIREQTDSVTIIEGEVIRRDDVEDQLPK